MNLDKHLDAFLLKHQLPGNFREEVEKWFLPLAENLVNAQGSSGRSIVVGINGCQGSGKSTLAAVLVLLLEQLHQLKAAALSIDDFYLTREQRRQLAREVHPLLAARGVPGTHDTALLRDTIEHLARPGVVDIPRFDKALDDRVPHEEWEQVEGPVDVVILEGWCLGVGPQSEHELVAPINALEAEEDTQGLWRRYVNQQLKEHYLPLYASIDQWVMLKAPSFDCVYHWRLEQETKLAASQGESNINSVMTPEQVARFIQYFQRLTVKGLVDLPAKVDYLFELDDRWSIQGCASL